MQTKKVKQIEQVKQNKFILPNKKVTLKPNYNKKMFMGSYDHDGSFMYTNTSVSWTIFRNQYGKYIDPLNDAEKVYFENKFKDRSFNPTSKDSFWSDFRVVVKKTSYNIKELYREFDLSDDIDYLSYKLLLTAPNVAKRWEDRNDNPEYKWVLVESTEELQSVLTKGNKKAFCYKWIDENTNKTDMLKNVLWLMNVNVSSDSNKDELLKTLYDLVESDKSLNKMYEELNNESLTINILIVKLLKSRIIITRLSKFYDRDSNLLAYNKDSLKQWLINPENSLTVEGWKTELKKYKF